MLVLRCSEQLAKTLRLPVRPTDAVSTGRLGDWYAALVQLKYGRGLVFMNERSLAAGISTNIRKDDVALELRRRLSRLLHAMTVPAAAAARELAEAGEVVFAPA